MRHQDTPQGFRRDGWTPARQLRFLDAFGSTRSVTRAAAAAGMSRESAYRLRKRASAGLFAAAWDRLLASPAPRASESQMTAQVKGHRRSKPRAWRQAVKDAGFAAFSTKGHEAHDPLFSLTPRSRL